MPKLVTSRSLNKRGAGWQFWFWFLPASREGEQPLGERLCQSWERSRLESRLSFEGDCSAEKDGGGDSFENSLREEERGFSSLLTFGLEVV